MTEAKAFIGLFLSAFLAATLIPAQSEIGLGYLVINTDYSMVLLVTVANLGNTAGATINWFIGLEVARSVVNSKRMKPLTRYWTIINWYKKYGQWTLLLSWAPFIGVPITVIAGVFKVPPKTFLLIVALAKTSRYILIAIFAEKFTLGLQTGAAVVQ
jgi:membrane protein YqaA with SNARE-associated domain